MCAAAVIAAAEDDGGVGLFVVVVLDLDLDVVVVGEIGAFEPVDGIGRIGAGEKPLRMLDDPGGIDAHVVGHHVAGEANAAGSGAVAQIPVGLFAAEVGGDIVGGERIGRGDGVAVVRRGA